jgi:hypothetical protein
LAWLPFKHLWAEPVRAKRPMMARKLSCIVLGVECN